MAITPKEPTANKATPSQFLTNFLIKRESSIPKGAQWAIVFENLSTLLPAISKAYSYEPGDISPWKTENAASIILTKDYQENNGCMFCQAIGLPGDGTEAVVEGNIKSNNFIRSYVGAGRSDFPIMRMTFLDTNVSFADTFLRGWSLATANFGLIMRSNPKYRTNLTCYKFGISPNGPYVLQQMHFKDICCIGVSEEEYQYSPTSAPVLREARFVYNSYTIDAETGTTPPNGSSSQNGPGQTSFARSVTVQGQTVVNRTQ